MRAVIDGPPIALKRHRMFKLGNHIRAFNSQEKEMNSIRNLLRAQLEPVAGPVHVNVKFYMPIPKSLSSKKRADLDGTFCYKKPDLDNLLKFLLDVLTGIGFHGDQQVVTISAAKIYSTEPQTVVFVSEH